MDLFDSKFVWLIPVLVAMVIIIIRASRLDQQKKQEHTATMRRLGFQDRSDNDSQRNSATQIFGTLEGPVFSRDMDEFTIWQLRSYDSDGPGILFWGIAFRRPASIPTGVTIVPKDAYFTNSLLVKLLYVAMAATGFGHILPVPAGSERFRAHARTPKWAPPLPQRFWDLLNRAPSPMRVEFRQNAVRITPIGQIKASDDPSKDTRQQAEFVERLAEALRPDR